MDFVKIVFLFILVVVALDISADIKKINGRIEIIQSGDQP